MTELDDRLRTLRDLDVPSPPDEAGLRTRVRHRRTRRVAAASVASLVVFAASFQMARTIGDDGRQPVVADDPAPVVSSTVPGPTTTEGPSPTTTAPPASSASPAITLDMPHIVFGPEGAVERASTDGGAVARVITTEPVAIAASLVDRVVWQGVDEDGSLFPPVPTGDIMVGDGSGNQAIPLPEAQTHRLLDARLFITGDAILVASRTGSSPDDAVETLRLVDEAGVGVVIDERPSWEAGSIAGRVLDDGSVVVLRAAEASLVLARYEQHLGGPETLTLAWEQTVGFDTTLDLVADGGDDIRLVGSRFEGDDFTPVLEVRRLAVDSGDLLDETRIVVVDPTGELGAGLFCTTYVAPDNRFLCGRSDGPPVAVVDDGRPSSVDGAPARSFIAAVDEPPT